MPLRPSERAHAVRRFEEARRALLAVDAAAASAAANEAREHEAATRKRLYPHDSQHVNLPARSGSVSPRTR